MATTRSSNATRCPSNTVRVCLFRVPSSPVMMFPNRTAAKFLPKCQTGNALKFPARIVSKSLRIDRFRCPSKLAGRSPRSSAPKLLLRFPAKSQSKRLAKCAKEEMAVDSVADLEEALVEATEVMVARKPSYEKQQHGDILNKCDKIVHNRPT